MEAFGYANLAVVAVTCGFSYLGFRDPAFKDRYLFRPDAILAGKQYDRLITSGLLHLNGGHLLLNMISLWFFGPLLEMQYGAWQFLAIYLASIIGGDLLALYIHRNHEYSALGASGGVCGVIFAYILLHPGSRLDFFYLPIGIPSWLYAVLFLVGSFAAMHGNIGNVGHDAHLGGALAGMFTAAGLHPQAALASPRLFGFITVATILLMIYLIRNPLLLSFESLDFTKSTRLPRPARKKPRTAPTPGSQEHEVDAILQKIAAGGMASLSDAERQTLKQVSAKYQRRAARQKPKHGFPL